MKINETSWIEIEPYQNQLPTWPTSGKHIMAQTTDEYIIVYQAYKKSIGKYAAENQHFGGDFSFTRMSWIKPNFLWMMYRSGWGTKLGQETTLAIFLKKDYFFHIVENAFPSTNTTDLAHALWKEKIAKTNVRLQWDPDHDPYGNKVERRAIQLGLRHEYLAPFKGEGIIRIEDISSFVAEQRKHIDSGNIEKLMTPKEQPIKVTKDRLKND